MKNQLCEIQPNQSGPCAETGIDPHSEFDVIVSDQKQDYFIGLGSRKIKVNQLVSQLEADSISYNPAYDYGNHIIITLVNHTRNFEAFTVKVTMGSFSTILKIYNTDQQSSNHSLHCLYGSCGSVYLIQWGEELQIAIKCVSLPQICEQEDGQQRAKKIIRTIKQYFFNLIASAVKIGPKIIKLQQFDLVIYSNCIEFSMERCGLTLEQETVPVPCFKKLRQSLGLMHFLKISHCDIKPDNIIYSKSFGRYVFIDFGLSKILPKQPGYKFMTQFVGSLETCCPEMTNLYVTKKMGYIDLYYNDVYCLKSTEGMRENRKDGNPLGEVIKFYNPQEAIFDNIKINYYLYENLIPKAASLIQKQKKLNRVDKVLEFTAALIPTEDLRQFYHRFIAEEWGESIRFANLSSIYKFSQKHSFYQRNIQFKKIGRQNQKIDNSIRLLMISFGRRLSLFQIDNDLIRLSLTKKIEMHDSKHVNLYNYFDQFLFEVSILRLKYIDNRNEEQLNSIVDTFLDEIVKDNIKDSSRKDVLYKDKLAACFKYLVYYCLKMPTCPWKIVNFEVILKQYFIIEAIEPKELCTIISKIASLRCDISIRLQLIVQLLSGLIFHLKIFGLAFNRIVNFPGDQSNNYYQIAVDQFERLIKENEQMKHQITFDCWMFRLLTKQSEISIEKVELFLTNFKQMPHEQQKIRDELMNYVLIMHANHLRKYEHCKLLIQNKLSSSYNPLEVRIESIQLANLYFSLGQKKKCYNLEQANLKINEYFKFAKIDFHFQHYHWKTITSDHQGTENYNMRFYRFIFLFVLINFLKKKQAQNDVFKLKIQQYLLEIRQLSDNDRLYSYLLCALKDDYHNKSLIISIFEEELIFYRSIHQKCDLHVQLHINNIITKLEIDILQSHSQYQSIYDKLSEYFKTAIFSLELKVFFYQRYFISLVMLGKRQIINAQISKLYEQQIKDTQTVIWISQFTTILIFRNLIQTKNWLEFKKFLLVIAQFIDTYPVPAHMNIYAMALRYAFNRPDWTKGEIAMVDKGINSLHLYKYEWKYPYVLFFHIEAVIVVARVLDKRQLFVYLAKIARYLPYVNLNHAKWAYQIYYPMFLAFNSNPRYKRYLLRKCRKMVNFVANFRNGRYLIKKIVLQPKEMIKIILYKQTRCELQRVKFLVSNFGNFGNNSKWKFAVQKLSNFHSNARNNNSKDHIKANYLQLLRLRVQ